MKDFGKWSKEGVPHKGWSLTDIDDTDDFYFTCEMCERTTIRYQHVMQHPNYPSTLSVGCVCAGRMSGDYEEAKRLETEYKKQKRKWSKLKWKTSKNGNPYTTTPNNDLVTVFKDKEGKYKFVTSRADGYKHFSEISYSSEEIAKNVAILSVVSIKVVPNDLESLGL